MLTLVLWQHVVLCVSLTLFRMSLVMIVRRMQCNTTHNHNQAHSKHRTTHTQNTTCCHSTKVNITK